MRAHALPAAPDTGSGMRTANATAMPHKGDAGTRGTHSWICQRAPAHDDEGCNLLRTLPRRINLRGETQHEELAGGGARRRLVT